MVDKSLRPAGTYELLSFNITPFKGNETTNADIANAKDIKFLIHTWEIMETITSGAVRGSAKVYDYIGLLYDFPLRGEEMIEVKYKDWRGTELSERFILYSITGVKPISTGGDTGLEYTIAFVSIGKFVSDKYDVRRCIASGTGASRNYISVSDQASVIFQDYFKERGNGTMKELYTTQSDGPQKIVIPAMRPEDAMHLLSRKAWSATYNSQNFRFFETREKYYFANMEDLIQLNSENVDFDDLDAGYKYIYSTGAVMHIPDEEDVKMHSIIAYEYPTLNNSHENMLSGAFYRKTNELNLSNRIEIVNEYNHLDEYKNYEYPDKDVDSLTFMNTSDFVDVQMNRHLREYVIKDYPGADEGPTARQRPATYYPDIYNKKGTVVYHYNASKVNIKIYGNNKLFPGKVIDVTFPDQRAQRSTNNSPDVERSGRYIIESIRNTFHEFTFYQDITLIKGAIVEDTVNTRMSDNTQTTTVVGPQ